jgi:alpha-tubulin suppressor-like RCC1 family protein
VLSDHSVKCLGSLTGADGVNNAVALSAGNTFTCALLSDGTAKCWGSNDDGTLGDNTQLSRRTPVSVVDLSNATAIAGGFNYNCALISDGTMKCWGNNSDGQLGTGTYADNLSAIPVSGLEGVESLGATGYASHNCAVLSSGQLACWGDNSYGQLGDSTTVSSLVPVLATGVTGAVAVAQSSYSTCVVLGTGSVECWGYDVGTGSLGTGTTTSPGAPILVPTKVVGVTQATAIAAGQFFNCAIADGTVKCWGYNSHGQLGTGDTTKSNVAVPVLW